MQTSPDVSVTLDAMILATIDGASRYLLLRATPATADTPPNVRYLLALWAAGHPTDAAELQRMPHMLLSRLSDQDGISILRVLHEGLAAIAMGATVYGPIDWISTVGKERVQILAMAPRHAQIVLILGPGNDPIRVLFTAESAIGFRDALQIADRAFGEELATTRVE